MAPKLAGLAQGASGVRPETVAMLGAPEGRLPAADVLLGAAMVAGALSTDAALGTVTPFDAGIHRLRGHPGQIECAAVYRALMAGSAIRASRLVGGPRVQDRTACAVSRR